MDEARLASRFNHPNLIQTYEVGEADGRYFLVMEYLDGQPLSALRSRMKEGVPLPIFLRVITRVLAGLHYAHELTDLHDKPLQVVHRDVSPQNVFLCYGGAIKLADFGIAKVADAAVKTRTGMFKGKLSYASPEQVAGEPVDRRSDIFAVGVMLWEELAGQRITHGASEAAIVQRRLLGGEPKILELRPDAPPELVKICEKAMALKADDRYATAAEMQQRLEEYMARAELAVTDVEVGELVARVFEEERTSVRKMIKERMASPSIDSGAPATLLRVHETSSPSLVEGNSSTGTGFATGAVGTSVETIAAPVAPRAASSWKRLVIPAGGAGLAVAVLVAAVLISRRAPEPLAAPAAVASTAPSAAPPAAVADIEVFLAVEPRTATLTLDDAPLAANPYQARRTPDGRAHTLRATATGFAPEQRTVSFERDVHIELALHASAPEVPSAGEARPARPVAAPQQAPVPGKVGGLRFQGDGRKARPPVENDDPYGGGR